MRKGKAIEFIPKGGMCAVCRYKDEDCSGLPFESMRVIKKSGGIAIVRCSNFDRFGLQVDRKVVDQ